MNHTTAAATIGMMSWIMVLTRIMAIKPTMINARKMMSSENEGTGSMKPDDLAALAQRTICGNAVDVFHSTGSRECWDQQSFAVLGHRNRSSRE